MDAEMFEDIKKNQSKDQMTVVHALDVVQTASCHSGLNSNFWQECEIEVDFLCKKLGLNRVQVLFVAVLAERGEAMSWRMFGQHFGLSRLKIMRYTDDLEDLMRREWIYPDRAHGTYGDFEGFHLAQGAIFAFRHDRPFVPKSTAGLTTDGLISRLMRFYEDYSTGTLMSEEEKNKWMLQVVERNPDLPLCSQILNLDDEVDKIILLYTALPNRNSHMRDGVHLSVIRTRLSYINHIEWSCQEIEAGESALFKEGLVEHVSFDGLADPETIRMTNSAKVKFGLKKRNASTSNSGLLALEPDKIVAKELYYNNRLRCSIDRLIKALTTEGLADIQSRLEECGMRKGVACLFYGSPGTGKTETALQIARITGRSVIKVDVAGIRDKYVGESEKNIRGIFADYRRQCSDSQFTPILLFNEADALINNRLENVHSSVDKMDNAIQNIILEELEQLEGVVIATTNLTGVIDTAFDRRFLFKIEFPKPDSEVKASIWQAMIPELDNESCVSLAEEFDFSGGQIENVARKCKIEFILTGQHPELESIRTFCREESLSRVSHVKIGFTA